MKLERLYREKDVTLDRKNIIEFIEKAKEIFIIDDVITNYKYNKNKKIELDISFPENYKRADINIFADDLLREVFINIFSNSIKYSNKSDIVSIDISIIEYTI